MAESRLIFPVILTGLNTLTFPRKKTMTTNFTGSPQLESAHDILHHTSRRPLDPIFSPKSVAVIGATCQ